MKINLKKALCYVFVAFAGLVTVKAINYSADNVAASLKLKVPGNPATVHPLSLTVLSGNDSKYALKGEDNLPVSIYQQIVSTENGSRITVSITALEDVYFNYEQTFNTGYQHEQCQFYMPGFWYRRNLRSPQEAPSFHTSDSWIVREDRLSAPLTGIYNEKSGEYITVTRLDQFETDALTTHKEGEVILSGKTSIGYTGFENLNGAAHLSFGFPYREAPKTYIRKLTLDPQVEAYQQLKKGETITLTWEMNSNKGEDFSDFVKQVWEYSYDTYRPEVVNTPYTTEVMKAVLSEFFKESYVSEYALKYYSGIHLHVDKCERNGSAEVGFIGRVLLNAFNALEYADEINNEQLKKDAVSVFDSYLENGFTPSGFLVEYIDFPVNKGDNVLSIRRQSEGIYAMFHYLQYEKEHKRKHPEWEKRIKAMLDQLLLLQNPDGSFPRKFKDDHSIVDASGGSTPSATLPLVMGYKYFKDKRYLESAKRTAAYLENELISKADYFSSTLDANCEDKEASIYAATATYYLALVSKGAERKHYADLCKKATYFALSWYYVWDLPFAEGQMLGDIGLKTRGWGNVSVENNHIDVFIFEFASVLDWLAREYNEKRFTDFAEVINTSMRQLLPHEGHLCGVAKTGYYPEVVQHTNWDYGKNGKGFYNDIFAPGWTVASLWELLTPGRAEHFFQSK